MVLPAHRVVQGVHPGIAPVAVEVEFGQAGAATGQFEKLFAGQQRQLGAQYLGFSYRNRGAGSASSVNRCSADFIQHAAGFAQQGFGCMQLNVQLADVGDHIGVITVAFDLGVDPRARAFAHKAEGVGNGAACNAQIDGGLDQLRYGALNVRGIVEARTVDHQLGLHPHIVEQHGAAGGGALAKARPVIHYPQAGRTATHEGLFHDNALISGMHTKLFFGMLIRLPLLQTPDSGWQFPYD